MNKERDIHSAHVTQTNLSFEIIIYIPSYNNEG